MKKSLLMFAMLGLAACGGGGGGGSGGAKNNFPTVALRDGNLTAVSGSTNITSNGSDKLATTQQRQTNYGSSNQSGGNIPGYTVTQTSDRIILNYNGVQTTMEFADDFKAGNKFIQAIKNSGTDTTDLVALGGKKLGLQYSDFGIWMHATNSATLANGSPRIDMIPFFIGNDANRATTGFNNTFAGTVVATAFDAIQGKSENVSGSASISFSVASNTLTAITTLNFDDFYKFVFTKDSTIDANGKFASSNGSTPVTVTNNGNATGINFSTGSHMVYMNGQFYGAGGTAQEAVGTFSITNNGIPATKGVVGAFGVK